MGLVEEDCPLFLRIPEEKLQEKTRALYYDPQEAQKIGALATRLLREAYAKSPTEMCGKSSKTLMAGALYMAGILEKLPRPQREVAEVCGCVQDTVRLRYRHLARILGYPPEDVREVLKEI